MSTTASLLAGTNPDVFAGVRRDGAADQYVFDAVDVASAQAIIDRGSLPGTSYRIEQVPRSFTELRALRDRVWALGLDTIYSTAPRSWNGTVAISISAVDEGALNVIAETFADERDAICIHLQAAPVPLLEVEPSLSGVEQTTTTVGPTTTVDREALHATWALSGDWLIHAFGSTDAEIDGFASFDPQLDGDRYVSTGYGQCFMFGGRAVESDGFTQVVPIEGADVVGVECDPGPSTDTYDRVIECLQAGCRLDLVGDVLNVSTSAGEPVADLVRTADEIPPR